MPRPKLTREERDTMRERIVDAALAIVHEMGPESLSIRSIAERMGVAHMSLYTYFANQGAILNALRERELAQTRAAQALIVQRAETEEITQVVVALLRYFMTFAREQPNMYRLAWVMPEVGGESVEESIARRQATVEQLAQLVTKGIQQGIFTPRDPFLAAGTALGIINMPFVFFYTGKIHQLAIRDQLADEALSAAITYLTASAWDRK